MPSGISARTSSAKSRLLLAGIGIALSTAYYSYVLIRIDPALVYYQQCPVFLTTLEFFQGFLGRPGGMTEYASVFFSQLNCCPRLGALVITASAALLCLATDRLLAVMSSRRIAPWLAAVPAVMMLVAYNRYNFRFTACVAVLIVLALANVYVRIPWRKPAARLFVFLFFSSAVFWLAAGGFCLLFAGLCGLFEISRRQRYVLGAACILLSPALPIAAALLFYDVSFARSFVLWMPFEGGLLPSLGALKYPPAWVYVSMLVHLPLAAVLAWQWENLLRMAGPVARHESALLSILPSCGFLVVAAGVIYLSFDAGVSRWLKIGESGENGKWEVVLSEAHALESELYDRFVKAEVERALYHTGRLSNDLFKYPQAPNASALEAPMHHRIASIWTPYQTGTGKLTSLFADTYLKVGQLNRAHQMLQVAYEYHGPQPRLLQQIARANILGGRPDVARIYLSALRENMLYRKWADDYLLRLAHDPKNARDPELEAIRPFLLNRDYLYLNLRGASYRQELLQCLDRNRHNRMAYELLMADLLLNKEIEQFAANLQFLEDCGVKELPQPYMEALLILAGSTQDANLIEDCDKLTDRKSQDRYFNFARVLEECRLRGLPRKEATARLLPEYGDSYYFYNVFGYSVHQPTTEASK